MSVILASLGQLADRSLEQALSDEPVDDADFWDAEDLATETGDHPCVWTDGCLESYPTAGFAVAGAGVYLPAPELAMQGAPWDAWLGVVSCIYASPRPTPDGAAC